MPSFNKIREPLIGRSGGHSLIIKKRGSDAPFIDCVGVMPLVAGTPLAVVVPLVVLTEVTYPMGYVAGYVMCYGTGYVTKKYLVFNFQ